jgi:putative RNA 2'-phosphotransferase
MPAEKAKLSRFLSFVLRHGPDSIGLKLDAQGWAKIDDLMARARAAGKGFQRDELLLVVETSDKKRFTISPDGLRIRAAQGHSIKVELGLDPAEPPPVLYHGTATRFLDAIWSIGLKPQSRRQVHLSVDVATGTRVGQRHGKPVILVVDAKGMQEQGFEFYRADNGVWLTDHVPKAFLTFGPAVMDWPSDPSPP